MAGQSSSVNAGNAPLPISSPMFWLRPPGVGTSSHSARPCPTLIPSTKAYESLLERVATPLSRIRNLQKQMNRSKIAANLQHTPHLHSHHLAGGNVFKGQIPKCSNMCLVCYRLGFFFFFFFKLTPPLVFF